MFPMVLLSRNCNKTSEGFSSSSLSPSHLQPTRDLWSDRDWTQMAYGLTLITLHFEPWMKPQRLGLVSFVFLVILATKQAENASNSSQPEGHSLGADGDQHPAPGQVSGTGDHLKNSLAEGEYAVLWARRAPREEHEEVEEDFCIIHYNAEDIPKSKREAEYLPVVDTIDDPFSGLPSPPCPSPAPDGDKMYDLKKNNSLILVKYNVSADCTLSDQAAFIETHVKGSRGMLIQLPRSVNVNDVKVNQNATGNPQFIVALISEKSVKAISANFNSSMFDIQVLIFAPHRSSRSGYAFDLSLVVIWLIAVVTVVIGSYWSGIVRAELFNRRKYELSDPPDAIGSGDESDGKKDGTQFEEEPYLNVSPVWVFFFVLCMGGMLLALYFFFKYLVYLIIGLFVLASILSLFACCDPLLLKVLPASWTSISLPLCSASTRTPVYQMVLFVASGSVALTWFFTRKEGYSWVLQDILGIFFSVNMLRTIRLPSFKICFILLSLLFFYDIFFVFLTPYLTSRGESVMVEVATGGAKSGGGDSTGGGSSGSQGETLPMVLRVPHLSIVGVNESDPLEICYRDLRSYSYSLLGFGDILVPGLLVSYCHAIDLIFGVPGRLYFVTTSIFYGLGLIVTFFGLYIMDGIPQPALLYLVPFTLLPPIIIALARKELRQFWAGPGDGSETSSSCGDSANDKAPESQEEAPGFEGNLLIGRGSRPGSVSNEPLPT